MSKRDFWDGWNSRLNSHQQRQAVSYLVDKQGGAWCYVCFRRPPDVELVLDHKDNNHQHNEPENWGLLCRAHNHTKNPRGPGRRKGAVDPRLDGLNDDRQQSGELRAKQLYWPEFCGLLFSMVYKAKLHRWEKTDLVLSAALQTGASEQTIDRYLRQNLSTRGHYRIEKIGGTDYVLFKPGFMPHVDAKIALDRQVENWKEASEDGTGKVKGKPKR